MTPPGEEDRPESSDWPIPPIGRIGEARDVAAAAVFYASDEAEFITGTTLLIDGGMTAGYHQREKNPLAEPGRRSADTPGQTGSSQSRDSPQELVMKVAGELDSVDIAAILVTATQPCQ